MNRVLLTLTTITFLALSWLPFISFSVNRFSASEGKTLLSLSPLSYGVLAALVLLMGVALAWRRFPLAWAAVAVLLLSVFLLLALFFLLGLASQDLMRDASPAARVAIGSAFWLPFLSLNLMLLDAWQRLSKSPHPAFFHWIFIAVSALLLLALGALFVGHHFDALSLAREYHNNQNRLFTAVTEHLQLVFIAFVPTLLLGLTLGSLVWRFPRFNGAFFGVLNFLQTIPSIALFALLMAPLSWLAMRYPDLQAMGISGIGTAPSVIALVLYTLLPLARNTYTGLAGVPTDTREAARAMGMTKAQIFRQIMIPLSLPMVLSGVRIVVVQLIGLTVVAALIGAGGLGIFVWQGLGQRALDLVLLGALPTIVLAVLADVCLQGLIWWAKPNGTN